MGAGTLSRPAPEAQHAGQHSSMGWAAAHGRRQRQAAHACTAPRPPPPCPTLSTRCTTAKPACRSAFTTLARCPEVVPRCGLPLTSVYCRQEARYKGVRGQDGRRLQRWRAGSQSSTGGEAKGAEDLQRRGASPVPAPHQAAP